MKEIFTAFTVYPHCIKWETNAGHTGSDPHDGTEQDWRAIVAVTVVRLSCYAFEIYASETGDLLTHSRGTGR